jgi:HSP20 family protein
MAEDNSKVPVQTEKSGFSALHPFRPFEDLRREIDRLFDDFGMWRSPFPRKGFQGNPAVDVTETDKAYEIPPNYPDLMKRTST